MSVVLVIVAASIFSIYSFLKIKKLDKVVYYIKKFQWGRYLERKNNAMLKQEQYGVIVEKGIFSKIDRMLDESGWRRIYSYLSSEVYLTVGFLVSIFLAFLCYLYFGRFFISFISICVTLLFWWLLLYISAAVRYKKIQNQLMFFINLLENYSRTSDDLIDIIAKTENYLEEPLKNVIAQFQWEARHTGEIETALSHLKVLLPHRKFQEIIQNLDMCRRHEANYDEVIRDMRLSVKEYLKSKEEKDNIRQMAKGSIIIMMFVGVFIIKLVNGFVEDGIFNLLSRSIFGICIIIYIIFLVLFGIWQFIKVDRD